MSRIDKKDLDLLPTGQVINLSSTEFAYIGGEFLSNENDYIEILIYDINENFLESGVVNPEDYSTGIDNNISLKQGTILRRMGYDRGRFVVKYNFLRKFAGSYENVLTDAAGTVLDENFDSTLHTEDMIKENKYFIEEISPSRTEIRLLPQNIKGKYIEDFYNMQREYKKINTGNAQFQFDNANVEVIGDSQKLTIANMAETTFQLQNYLVGGKLQLQQAFVSSYTPWPVVYIAGDAPVERETEMEAGNMLQPSFFIDAIDGPLSNDIVDGQGSSALVDYTLTAQYSKFVDFNDGATVLDSIIPLRDDAPAEVLFVIPTSTGTQTTWPGDEIKTISEMYSNDAWRLEAKMSNIVGLQPDLYNTPHSWDVDGDGSVTIYFKSNSTLPDIPTVYTWQIIGFNGGNFSGFLPITHVHRNDAGEIENWTSGHVEILTPDQVDATNTEGQNSTDETYAQSSTINPLVAIHEYDGLSENSGCSIAIRMRRQQLIMGLMLTIHQPTGIGSRTICYPVVART